MDDRQRLAQLEARARILEAELTGLNATIATLKARLSTQYAQPSQPVFAPVGMPSVSPVQPRAYASSPAGAPPVSHYQPQAYASSPAGASPVPQSQPQAYAPIGVPSVPPPPQDFRSYAPQAVAPVSEQTSTPPEPMTLQTATTEAPVEESQQDGVYLPPLQPYDTLRQKWNIGTGEASAGEVLPSAVDAPVMDSVPPVANAEPELRLFGLLSDGSPWEYRIPFSCMASEEGIFIGRDAEYAQVVLDDGSVSRCHLRLELTEQGVVVTDMDSTNGSVINDHVIEEYENRLPLNDGDTLTLGNVTLQAQFLQ